MHMQVGERGCKKHVRAGRIIHASDYNFSYDCGVPLLTVLGEFVFITVVSCQRS